MFSDMGQHLMGAREIEERLGVSRQRVQQLIARPDWPAPYDELAMGKVWLIEDVEAWIKTNRPADNDQLLQRPAPDRPW
jgi:prophage regulatory protein